MRGRAISQAISPRPFTAETRVLIPRLSMRDLLLTDCHWNTFNSEHLVFSPVGIIPPIRRTDSVVYHWRCATLEIDSIVKQHALKIGSQNKQKTQGKTAYLRLGQHEVFTYKFETLVDSVKVSAAGHRIKDILIKYWYDVLDCRLLCFHPLTPSGYNIYHQVSNSKFCVQPTECIVRFMLISEQTIQLPYLRGESSRCQLNRVLKAPQPVRSFWSMS
jgi:hypothetical protein